MFNLLYGIEALMLVYDSKATMISITHHAVILKTEIAIDREENFVDITRVDEDFV